MTTVAQDILRDRLQSGEYPEQAKAAVGMAAAAMQVYQALGERAAMRCALGDASSLCDALARDVENHNRGIRGRVTVRGEEKASSLRACAEALWLMREKITVPQSGNG